MKDHAAMVRRQQHTGVMSSYYPLRSDAAHDLCILTNTFFGDTGSHLDQHHEWRLRVQPGQGQPVECSLGGLCSQRGGASDHMCI